MVIIFLYCKNNDKKEQKNVDIGSKFLYNDACVRWSEEAECGYTYINRMEGTSVEYVLGLDLGDKFDNVTNLSKAL